MVGKGRRERRDATTRADTLALSFGSAATMIIAIIGIFLVFEAAGVDITTVLGGAAVLGVAIAFDAQNLMRDYFNGFRTSTNSMIWSRSAMSPGGSKASACARRHCVT